MSQMAKMEVSDNKTHSIWLYGELVNYWIQSGCESLDKIYDTYQYSLILIWPSFAMTIGILMRTLALSEPYTPADSQLESTLNMPQTLLSFYFMAILTVPTLLEFLMILKVTRERGAFSNKSTLASRTLSSLLCFCASSILLCTIASFNILAYTNFRTWEASADSSSASFLRMLVVVAVWVNHGFFRFVSNVTVPSVYTGAFTAVVSIAGPFTSVLVAAADVAKAKGTIITIVSVIRAILLAAVIYKDVSCIYLYIRRWLPSVKDLWPLSTRDIRDDDESIMTDEASETIELDDIEADLPSQSPSSGLGTFNLASLNTPAPSDDFFGFTPGFTSTRKGEFDYLRGIADGDDERKSRHSIGSKSNNSGDTSNAKSLRGDSDNDGRDDEEYDCEDDEKDLYDKDDVDDNDSNDNDDEIRSSHNHSDQSGAEKVDSMKDNKEPPSETIGAFLAFNSLSLGLLVFTVYTYGLGEDASVGQVSGVAATMSYVMLFILRCTSFFLLDENLELLIVNQEEQSRLQMKRELLRRFLPDDVIRSVQMRSSSVSSRGALGTTTGDEASNTATVSAERDADGSFPKHAEDLVVSFLDISLIDAVMYSIIGDCISSCTPMVTANSITFRFNLSEVLKRMDNSQEGGAFFM